MKLENGRIDLDSPRWSQETFGGRFKHFWSITDWRNGLNSEKTLDDSKKLLELYKYDKIDNIFPKDIVK